MAIKCKCTYGKVSNMAFLKGHGGMSYGFTLIEVLVSLSVFSVMLIAGWKFLFVVSEKEQQIKARAHEATIILNSYEQWKKDMDELSSNPLLPAAWTGYSNKWVLLTKRSAGNAEDLQLVLWALTKDEGGQGKLIRAVSNVFNTMQIEKAQKHKEKLINLVIKSQGWGVNELNVKTLRAQGWFVEELFSLKSSLFKVRRMGVWDYNDMGTVAEAGWNRQLQMEFSVLPIIGGVEEASVVWEFMDGKVLEWDWANPMIEQWGESNEAAAVPLEDCELPGGGCER